MKIIINFLHTQSIKKDITIINSNKIENKKFFDNEINKNFNFIRAKLFGFTEKNNSNPIKIFRK